MLASKEQERRIMVPDLFLTVASNSGELLCVLESFPQRRVPLAGIGSPHSHPQRFLRSHQDDEFLASGEAFLLRAIEGVVCRIEIRNQDTFEILQ